MATVSKSLNIQTEGVYTLDLNIIPDGATVTPVNDIQTWLHCAGIYNKSYTTLDEVLGDSSTLLALISDNNAADYMARSTDWVGNVALIPKMTSNTQPSGTASATNTYSSGYPAYYAFDDNPTTFVLSTQAATAPWEVVYTFANPIKLPTNSLTIDYRIYFQYAASGINATIDIFNDDTNSWETLKTLGAGASQGTDWVGPDTITGLTGTYSKIRYRISAINNVYSQVLYSLQVYTAGGITGNQLAMQYIGNNNYCSNALLSNVTWGEGIANSAYFESVLNTKVPTMTSNTAPAGECFSGNTDSAGAYNAFDNNDATQALGAYAYNSTGIGYVGYDFGKPVLVKRADFIPVYMGPGGYGEATLYSYNRNVSFEGSNDKTNWTSLCDPMRCVIGYNKSWKAKLTTQSTTKYRYYRVVVDDYMQYYELRITKQYWRYFDDVQFYGRE